MKLNLFSGIRVHRDSQGGLFLILPRRDVPLSFHGIRVGGGQLLEPEDKGGLADLASDLMNEGPQGIKAMDWHRNLEQKALKVTAYPSTLAWSCYAESLSEDEQETLSCLQALATNPGLPRASWKRLRDEALAQEMERWAQPSDVLAPWALAQALGPGHVAAREAHPYTLSQITYEETRDLASKAMERGSWFSAVAGGDLDEDKALAHLQELRDLLPLRKEKEEAVDLEPRPSTKKVWILDHQAWTRLFCP